MNEGYTKTKIDKRILYAFSILAAISIILAIVIPTTLVSYNTWPSSIKKIDNSTFEEKIDNGDDFLLYVGLDSYQFSESGNSDPSGIYSNSGYFIQGKESDYNFGDKSGGLTLFSELGLYETYAITSDNIADAELNAESVYRYMTEVNGNITTGGATIDKDNFIWIIPDGNTVTKNATLSDSNFTDTLGVPQKYSDFYAKYKGGTSGDIVVSENLYFISDLHEGNCTIDVTSSDEENDVILFNNNKYCHTDEEKLYTDDKVVSVFNSSPDRSIGSYYSHVAPQIIKFGNRPDGTYGIEFTSMFISSTLKVDSYISIYNWFEDSNYELIIVSSLESWEIALIVIGSIAAVSVIAFSSYKFYIYKMVRK